MHTLKSILAPYKKKLTIASICLFTIVTTISTITSSIIDNGSWVITDPFHESGHHMTLVESILHNLPPSIIEGLVFTALMIGMVFLVEYLKKEIFKIKESATCEE